MLGANGKSVLCDFCGAEILFENNKLNYYSIDFKTVECMTGRPCVADSCLDVDACKLCYGGLFDRIKKINKENNAKIERARTKKL